MKIKICIAITTFLPLLVESLTTRTFHRSPPIFMQQSIVAACDQTDNNQQQQPGLCIGFLGCGTIATALATGLATQRHAHIQSMVVSRRSARNSEFLQNNFPHLVTVRDNNQHIVNQADILFVTVLPQDAEQVLQALEFTSDKQIIVSLVATMSLDQLRVATATSCSNSSKELPAAAACPRIYKMICLPAVATHEGVCLLQTATTTAPKQQEQEKKEHAHSYSQLTTVLQSLGSVVVPKRTSK
jgi:hypothetical protein